MTTYTGFVQNGQIRLEGDSVLPEGARVRITVVSDESEEIQGISVEDLLNAPFIGLWADRDDIGDTATFAEELRRRSNRRE